METPIPVFDNCSISDSAQENFLVMDLEQYILKHPDIVFPHRHSFYHLVLFTGGHGGFTIDFTDFTIEPHQVYFMSPGQVHTWDFEGVPQGYVINFSYDFFHSLLLNPDYIQQFSFFGGTASENVIIVPEMYRKQIIALLDELLGESTRKCRDDRDLLRIILLHFFHLADIQREGTGPSGVNTAGQALLEQFKNLVELHFKQEKFPSFYADKLHISSNHLNNICKSHLGKQAGEFIRERIVLEAKRLLINPGSSISSLSYELNFNDNSYFTKFFKKSTGMTPEEFRRKHIHHRSYPKPNIHIL